MKKIVLFIVLLTILFTSFQCTEDDTIEASLQKDNPVSLESGEEGAQDTDTKRD